MIEEQQLSELKRVYGALGGVEVANAFSELKQYMDNPAASFRELVSNEGYKRGLKQDRFEQLVRRAGVPQYLRDYKARIEVNRERGDSDSRIRAGDIRIVLQCEIPRLLRHGVTQVVASKGRKVAAILSTYSAGRHEPSTWSDWRYAKKSLRRGVS